ncbi:MAG: response regulator transcription factor [Acidobacteriota bacterium]
MRVLVIEDDLDIASNIGDYLSARGHGVDFAYDGISGMHLALTGDFDALVIDIMLPGMSGLDLCQKLRTEARRSTPALMLTARDTLDDKLDGFAAGADDYMVKPFALQELEARLLALQRRGQEPGEGALEVADLRLDPATRSVVRDGRRLSVQGAAFDILRFLMERSPEAVKRQEIEEMLWPDEPPPSDVLRSHIYGLRRAIDRPFSQPLLHTLRGYGFQLASLDDD